MSINSSTAVVHSGRREELSSRDNTKKDILLKKEKEHNRSNSTISKKSTRDIKNCFKIDLSKFNSKEEIEERAKIDSRG